MGRAVPYGSPLGIMGPKTRQWPGVVDMLKAVQSHFEASSHDSELLTTVATNQVCVMRGAVLEMGSAVK